MNNEEKKIYHIKPVFTQALWGGQQLKEKYGYESDLDNIGECYNVIALKGFLDCDVLETKEKLSDFYHNNLDLFGCDTKEMPVRAAMACTIMPMSVQIHPDNEYALKYDGKLGKPDGVYVIEGKGTVEFGHYALTKEEFRELVETENWDKLLRYIPVEAGDFLDMPFGTLHALGANMVYIEFSQNADNTYRLYDYKRQQIDPKTGKPRTLQVEKVIDCVTIPQNETSIATLEVIKTSDKEITIFHDEPGLYSCGKIVVRERAKYNKNEFYFLTCIEGFGKINEIDIKGGETLFVPKDFGEIELIGDFTLTYVTYVKP